MIEIFRSAPLVERGKEPPANDLFLSLLENINAHFDTLTFLQAAQETGYSSAYFSSWFQSNCGMSFTEYLTAVRVMHALQLLRRASGERIADIAYACGFGSIRQFNRQFRKVTGHIPSDLTQNPGLIISFPGKMNGLVNAQFIDKIENPTSPSELE